MAAYFLDTSALVKRYHPEAGTPIVDQVFSESGASIIVSRLVMVEIVSAFALKVRSGTISTSKLFSLVPWDRQPTYQSRRIARVRFSPTGRWHGEIAENLAGVSRVSSAG